MFSRPASTSTSPRSAEPVNHIWSNKGLSVDSSFHPLETAIVETAPLAQLDRASGYEPEGREFESLRAHHSSCFQLIPNYPLPDFMTTMVPVRFR